MVSLKDSLVESNFWIPSFFSNREVVMLKSPPNIHFLFSMMEQRFEYMNGMDFILYHVQIVDIRDVVHGCSAN